AVDAGGGLHDDALDAGRLLAGGHQLHRAEDVDVLLDHPTTGIPWCRDDTHVDDRVDVGLGQQPCEQRATDIGADILPPTHRVPWRHEVNPDDALDRRVVREPTHDAPREIAGHAGDQD